MSTIDTESTAVQVALATDDATDTPTGEAELVRRMEEEDIAAQKLEDAYRKEWNKLRDYVAGTQQQAYTVQTNVIAPKLNALLPLIYARDPEPSCRPSEAVDPANYADVKAFATTLAVVIKREWGRNRRQLKRAAKRAVRSAQTVSLGYLKAAFCCDTMTDPVMQQKLNSLQDNLKMIDSLVAQDQTGATNDDLELRREQILLQMQVVKSGLERQVVKGQVIEPVRADDMLWAPSVRELQDYCQAPWGRQNIYMPATQAMRQFSLTKEQIGKAKIYRMRGEKNDATPQEVSGASVSNNATEIDWVCVRERWSLEDGLVYQWLAGCNFLLAPAAPPQYPTSRFYPFYQLGYNWVDDRRYPISDVANMTALQDEYSARRSAARTWRERSKPGRIINGQALSSDDTKRLTASEIQENVVLQDLDPNVPLANVVAAAPLPSMDLAMLDTGDIMRELEMLSGAQDASTGSVTTAKTATEAELLDQGNRSKGGEKVDTLDDLMSELAQATAEQALQAYSEADVIRIAGKGAVWPTLSLDELQDNVVVEIQAGSMGKPNTTQQQEGWSQLFPLISQTADEIAQLEAPTATPNPPGSPTPITLTPPSPDKLALAEAKRALIKETVKRFDERIDVDQFLPPKPEQANPAGQMMDPMSGAEPTAAMAPTLDPTAPAPPALPAVTELLANAAQRPESQPPQGAPVTTPNLRGNA